MSARPTSLSCAQPTPCAGYSESPLRSVMLLSDPCETSPSLQATPSGINRRNSSRQSSLQSIISSSLGTSEPVDLLPHISKRNSIPSRRVQRRTSVDENRMPSLAEDATPETQSVDGASSPDQGNQENTAQPYNSPWTTNDVLYTIPPGSRVQRA